MDSVVVDPMLRAIPYLTTAVACLAALVLGCVGPIAPTACVTDAQCAADTTCERSICVYRQGYGEGGAGGADGGALDGGDSGPDSGDSVDAG